MPIDYTPKYANRIVRLIGLEAVVKDSALRKLINGLEKKIGSRKLLGKWADTYLAFIHNRHIDSADGGGSWARISDTTKRLRRAKDRKTAFTRNIDSILIDMGQLLATSAPGGRGQIRKLDTNNMAVKAGVSGTTVYYEPRKMKRRRRSLGQLVQWHRQTGRNIIVAPNEVTKEKMQQDAREWVFTLIK